MNLDKKILYALQKIRTPVLDKVCQFVTHIAEFGLLWIVTAVVTVFFAKTRIYGIQLGVCLLLCGLIGEVILKPLIRRKRPFHSDDTVKMVLRKPRDHSMPSGHTASFFACSFVTVMFDWRIGIACYFLSVCIAFTRVYHFVHFPSDVLVGAILGTLCGVAAVFGVRAVYPLFGTTALLGWEGFSFLKPVLPVLSRVSEQARSLFFNAIPFLH